MKGTCLKAQIVVGIGLCPYACVKETGIAIAMDRYLYCLAGVVLLMKYWSLRNGDGI